MKGQSRSAGTNPAPAGPVPDAFALVEESADAVQMLRTGGSIAILFLLLYLAYDLSGTGARMTAAAAYHWLTLAVALLFFGSTWTSVFHRYWKLWNLAFSVLLISVFILISLHTREGDSRYIAILLFPVATASFVKWGWRWQLAMALMCAAMYATGEWMVPLRGSESVYRWFGIAAAAVLSVSTSVFMERYRGRIRAQFARLLQAAEFRENQIATMAHDIRSPVAALAGFADLLEDEELSEAERRPLLARIGTTAWNIDLTVSNVLDLYQLQERRIASVPMRLEPNRIVNEEAANCAVHAVRKGLRLVTNYGEVPAGNYDPRHLERVVRNLLAYSIGRLQTGEVRLRTEARGAGGIAIEVADDGPAPEAAEFERLSSHPPMETLSARVPGLGLFIARGIVETEGGRLTVGSLSRGGFRIAAEIPSAPLAAAAGPS